MARRLKLTVSETVNVNWDYFGAYRVRIDASDAEGVDARVFVHRQDPANAYTGEPLDTFMAVASPVDMTEYPPEEPDAGNQYPFFRRAWVEMDFRNISVAKAFVDTVVREVNVLLAAFGKLEDLQVTQTVWCGDGAPDPGSASSGSSGSTP